MNREYLRWYSPRLHRDMELLVFGHAGAKVLMFPTRDGRFWEYEKLGLVESLRDKLQAGQRYGLIRFGSRTDLLVPAGTELRVQVGDRVRGGETVMGMLRES